MNWVNQVVDGQEVGLISLSESFFKFVEPFSDFKPVLLPELCCHLQVQEQDALNALVGFINKIKFKIFILWTGQLEGI